MNQVLPFPIPTRPVLQQSAHPRGARVFFTPGRLDSWYAPGIVWKNGMVQAAIDAAWLVERYLGPPRPRQPALPWPGVPNAAKRARSLAQSLGLYEFQQEGAAFLAERDYACLLDAMGCGKSPQAIAAAEARLSLGVIPSNTTPCVLILCPALAKRHWQREIKRWANHDAAVVNTLRAEEVPTVRYVIANYDILAPARRRDAAGVITESSDLRGWGRVLAGQFLIVICDESHMLRGRSSQRTKAVKAVCKSAPVVWLLTGTVMPNYVRDLWSQIDLVSGALHGKYWEWAKAYCNAHEGKHGWVDTGAERMDELGQRMAFFMLGRTKEAVQMQLPEKRREIYHVDVDITAPTVHDAEQAKRKMAVMKALRATGKAKRSAIVGQSIEALQAGQKVIVGVYMREQAEAVAKDIKKAFDGTLLCVHGDMEPDGRDKQAQTFRECASPAAFVCTIDSVGLAISLVGADLVILGDLSYEPHKLLQFESRAHRHGSTNRVIVRYLVAVGTIDEAVAETVLSKLTVIEETLGKTPDGAGITEMLAPNVATEQEIVDNLFAKLKAWGKK